MKYLENPYSVNLYCLSAVPPRKKEEDKEKAVEQDEG
jgi:hypothetical protein